MSCAVGSDAVVAVDIVQVSTGDNCSKCEKELTHIIDSHMGLQVIFFPALALAAAVILAPAELVLIAGAVKVRPHQHFNPDSIWITF